MSQPSKEYKQSYYRANRARLTNISERARLLRMYGITPEQYDQMLLEQQGRCKICPRRPSKRKLNIDHCHKTGKVRGLLCWRCNQMLGYAGDQASVLRGGADYLERNA